MRALENAADHAVVGVPLDLKLLEPPVDQQGDSLFERLGIDDQLAIGGLLFLKNAQDLLEKGRCLERSCALARSSRESTSGASVMGGGWANSESYWAGSSALRESSDGVEAGMVDVVLSGRRGASGLAVAAQEIPAERSVSRREDHTHVKSFRKR
jgi:hypothetical protein